MIDPITRPTSAPSRVPGPRGFPLLGNLFDLREGLFHEVLLRMHQEHGDLFRLRFPGGRDAYVVRDPEVLRHVLQMNNGNYVKGARMQIAAPLIGNGLFLSEGAFWRRQRRLLQPAFVRPSIALLVDTMVQTVQEMLDRWQIHAGTGQPLNIQDEMMRLAMEVVTRTLFTNSLTPEEVREVGEQFTFLLEVISERGQEIVPISHRLPSRRNRRFRQALERIDRLIYRLIEDRRRSGEYGTDLLGKLLQARDQETGQGMDDRQLRDELVTLFLAGHETTAITLTWALGMLSTHPAVRRRLQAEVDMVLDGRRPTAPDLDRLTYTRAVFSETLRIYPPLPVFMRESVGPDELAGIPIGPGETLLIHVYGVHHHEGYWDNPEGFEPERFLPGGRGPGHRFAYIPFGAGPRQCIGNHFALAEGTLALAMIHQRYVLNLTPGAKLEVDAVGTLRPKGGLWVHIQGR